MRVRRFDQIDWRLSFHAAICKAFLPLTCIFVRPLCLLISLIVSMGAGNHRLTTFSRFAAVCIISSIM